MSQHINPTPKQTDITSLSDQIGTEQTSTVFSNLKYKLLGNMMLVCGYFAGNGTSAITTGLGNYNGVLNGRNSSTGVMALYFHSSGQISGWDGSTSRTFTSGQNYMVYGVLYKQS